MKWPACDVECPAIASSSTKVQNQILSALNPRNFLQTTCFKLGWFPSSSYAVHHSMNLGKVLTQNGTSYSTSMRRHVRELLCNSDERTGTQQNVC